MFGLAPTTRSCMILFSFSDEAEMFLRSIGNTLIRPALRDRQGAALIEFTLVAPLLFSLVLGTIEFGRYLEQHHVLTKSARDASRYLSRIEMNCAGTTTFCCPSTDASWSTAETVAKNLAMRGSTGTSDPFVLDTWTDPSTISFTVTCLDNTGGGYRGQDKVPVVRTSISVPYTEVGFLSFLGIGPLTLSASHEEVNFGE